jgi:hypothetical protein
MFYLRWAAQVLLGAFFLASFLLAGGLLVSVYLISLYTHTSATLAVTAVAMGLLLLYIFLDDLDRW